MESRPRARGEGIMESASFQTYRIWTTSLSHEKACRRLIPLAGGYKPDHEDKARVAEELAASRVERRAYVGLAICGRRRQRSVGDDLAGQYSHVEEAGYSEQYLHHACESAGVSGGLMVFLLCCKGLVGPGP